MHTPLCLKLTCLCDHAAGIRRGQQCKCEGSVSAATPRQLAAPWRQIWSQSGLTQIIQEVPAYGSCQPIYCMLTWPTPLSKRVLYLTMKDVTPVIRQKHAATIPHAVPMVPSQIGPPILVINMLAGTCIEASAGNSRGMTIRIKTTKSPLMGQLISGVCARPKCCSTRRECMGSHASLVQVSGTS